VDTFLQQVANGLTLGSIYALVALGYTLVYGILGLINFAHGEVVMVGALTALAASKFLLAAALPPYLVFMLAFLLAALVCMALSVIIERIAYRPLRNAPRLAPLITAIGVSIILQQLAMMLWGRNYHAMPQLLPEPHAFALGGVQITVIQIVIMRRCRAVLMAALLVLADHAHAAGPCHARHGGESGHGRADGRRRANRIIVLHLRAWFGAGRPGRHAGGVELLALRTAFTAAVLGGIGNIGGAVLGGLLLGVIESAGRRLHRRPDRRRAGQPLSGCVRLLRADPGAGVPAVRTDGRTGGGAGMNDPSANSSAHATQGATRADRHRAGGAAFRGRRRPSATPGCASSTLRCCS
jgi:branched-chain amino acid transport system permease protein